MPRAIFRRTVLRCFWRALAVQAELNRALEKGKIFLRKVASATDPDAVIYQIWGFPVTDPTRPAAAAVSPSP